MIVMERPRRSSSRRAPPVDLPSEDEDLGGAEIQEQRPAHGIRRKVSASRGTRGRRGRSSFEQGQSSRESHEQQDHDEDENTQLPGEGAERVPLLRVRPVTFTTNPPYNPLNQPFTIGYGPHKNTGKSQKLQSFRNSDPFEVEEHIRFEDSRFFHQIHAIYYHDVILKRKKTPILPQKFVNWRGCREMGEPPLNQALAILTRLELRNIMEFHHNWNKEVIGQFYATLWYSNEETNDDEYKRYLHFAYDGEYFKCSYKRFARILGFDDNDLKKECVHSYNEPRLESEINEFHLDLGSKKWVTTNLKPMYRYLYLLSKNTLLPKGGDAQAITKDGQRFLSFFTPNSALMINVFDMIWNEIYDVSTDTRKSCVYPAFIMKMIEVVTQKIFEKDSVCEPYTPKAIHLLGQAVAPEDSDPIPDPPHHAESSRAASAGRPFVPTRDRRSGRHRGGAVGAMVRGLRSIFQICRDNQVDQAAYQARQNVLVENFERFRRGEDPLPVPPPPAPRDLSATNLDDFHQQQYGYQWFTSDVYNEGTGEEEEVIQPQRSHGLSDEAHQEVHFPPTPPPPPSQGDLASAAAQSLFGDLTDLPGGPYPGDPSYGGF